MNNYFTNSDYIGATGNFPIIDYIDITSNILNDKINSNVYSNLSNVYSNISNINSNINELKFQTYHINSNNPNSLIGYNYNDYIQYNAIHTNIFIDSHQNSKLIFRPRYNNQSTPHKTEIRYDGRLYVYLDGNLLPPISAGWYGVGAELQSIFIKDTNQDVLISGLETQTLDLQTQIITMNTKLSALTILDTATGSFTTISTQLGNFALWQYVVGSIVASLGVVSLYSIASANRAENLANMINASYVSSNALNELMRNTTITQNEKDTLSNSIQDFRTSNKFLISSNFYELGINQGFINCNITNQQFIPLLNTNELKFNNSLMFEYAPANQPTFFGGSLISINPTTFCIQFLNDGTLTIPATMNFDVLVCGAGGRGGTGAYGGGGGGGEVVYIQNYTLPAGNYSIQCGIDSATFTDRQSKLYIGGFDFIKANGGGDGGDFLATITTTTNNYVFSKSSSYFFNYETTIYTLPAGTYNITFNTGSITLNSVVDKSYPILKDVNGANINPNTWYKFDNNTNLGIDEYGLANMTNTGSVQTALTSVKGNYAISTNGSTNYLSTTTAFNLNNKDFSLCCWIKLKTSTTGTKFIYAYNGGGTETTSFSCSYRPSNAIRTSFNNSFVDTTSPVATVGNFIFYAMVYDNTTRLMSVYINGALINSATFSTSLNSTIATSYAFGRRNLAGTIVYGDVEVDDFRIYGNRKLTLAQIQELYNGRINLFENGQSGGSGGGGYGSSSITLSGASAGTPFSATYSKLTAGANGTSTKGGNGGSALATGAFNNDISGVFVDYGLGGVGATASSTPQTPSNSKFGTGGDGNGGLGRKGALYFRYNAPYITKFLEYTNWNKLFNVNVGDGLKLNEANNNLISSYWTFNNNNLYNNNSGNIGIGTNAPLEKFHIYNPNKFLLGNGYDFIRMSHDGYIVNLDIAGADSYFSIRMDYPPDWTNYNSVAMYDIITILGDGSGFVGIQKTAPTSALDVNGTIKANALILAGAISGATTISASGNTTALKFTAGNTYLQDGLLSFVNNSYSSGKIQFGVGSWQTYSGGYIERVGVNYGNNPEYANRIVFSCEDMETRLNNGFYFTGASFVGIGVMPDRNFGLKVSGAINASGTISASSFSGALSGNSTTATTATYYYPRTNEWINDNAGRSRFYFANNGTNSHSYYRSGSTVHYFRDSSDVDICAIDRFSISGYFEVVSSTTDYIAVIEPNALPSFQYRTMLIKFGSFTEFHRCYLEDELYNGNYEEFVNEYVGRVVVSTGRIKRWEKEQGKDAEVLIDKEAISIDDAQPIIKLSRRRKDKAIYGVITNRPEKSDADRICVNAVGEGAIWVVNSNGNIQNGDLLQTSDYLGYAEKQDDDLVRNYTIAKVVMDCNFELDSPYYKCEEIEGGIRKAFLACVYMCG